MLLPLSSETPRDIFGRLIASLYFPDNCASIFAPRDRPGGDDPLSDTVINSFGLALHLVATCSSAVERRITHVELLFATMFLVRESFAKDAHFRLRWSFFVHACFFRWAERGELDPAAPLPFFADAPDGAELYDVLYVTDRDLRRHPYPFLALIFGPCGGSASAPWKRPHHLGRPDLCLPLKFPATLFASASGRGFEAAQYVLLSCLGNAHWARPDVTHQLENALEDCGDEKAWTEYCVARRAQLDFWCEDPSCFSIDFVWNVHRNRCLLRDALRSYLRGTWASRSHESPPENCTLHITLGGRDLALLILEAVEGDQATRICASVQFPCHEDLREWWIGGPDQPREGTPDVDRRPEPEEDIMTWFWHRKLLLPPARNAEQRMYLFTF